MNFYSTNNIDSKFSFQEAVINGLAPDGGLFMPEYIPLLDKKFIENLVEHSLQEIAIEVSEKFIGDEINKNELINLVEDAINFPSPVITLKEGLNILELFHGPTLAFKDFGARFMSRIMGHFLKDQNHELNILVATSGDTGSAVASGFYGVEGINVYILYPSGKVSPLQEKQLTTLGKNITALEIDGTFDDCQRMVKQAFVDEELKSKMNLSSANSINIARLIPQSFYYFDSFKQIKDQNKPVIYCVPSGNLGNLTAGLMAKKMGLPIDKFIAATNLNSGFTDYINTNKFIPRDSVKTLSNAMDVGNPSNLTRIINLFLNDHSLIVKEINSSSHDDVQTLRAIRHIYEKYNYIIDPHGAVGILAIEEYAKENREEFNYVVLETAHPAKFGSIVNSAINNEVHIPERLAKCMTKEKSSIKLKNDYSELSSFLLSN